MSVVVTTVALSAAPAMGAGGSERPGSAGNTELPRDVELALQRDLGLNAEQAKRHGALQAKAIKLDAQLRGSLGADFAGSSYDATTGKLVVRVADAGKLDDARAAGADARLVKRSQAELDAITAELDKAAGKADGAARRPSGPRQASLAGITSWYVDTASNTVRVTVKTSHVQQAKSVLAKYGDAVTIEASDLEPAPAADYMDGGDLINGSSCSAGFNLRNPSTGQGYLLTAGHCVTAGSTLSGQGGWWGVNFGPVLESWFPSYDDAIARNDNGGHWIQGPWVDYNPSNGGIITTRNYTDAPIGTTVCKAGITTKWTCGTISGKNQTVTYSGGKTVYGLTRHTACVEPGDSGGANVSYTGSYAAEGVTSGASLVTDSSGRKRCLQTIGQTNVSWYYPIAKSLAHYGPRYGVFTW